MTEETQVNTINFNGTEYDVDLLNDKAKYIISQLKELRVENEKLRRKLDRTEVASEGFTNLLSQELEGDSKDSPSKTAEEFVAE